MIRYFGIVGFKNRAEIKAGKRQTVNKKIILLSEYHLKEIKNNPPKTIVAGKTTKIFHGDTVSPKEKTKNIKGSFKYQGKTKRAYLQFL